MSHNEISSMHLYKIDVPFKGIRLFISFEQTFDQIKNLLLSQGVPMNEVRDYVDYGKKGLHIQGRTTVFIDQQLVLIKINYFDHNIRSIVILVHEILHAAKKILYLYESSQEKELLDKEEAECYLMEYIFEELMKTLKPTIRYEDEYRNMEWLNKITHETKETNL